MDIRERLRIDREAKSRGIDPRALWTAAHDEAAHLPDREAATMRIAGRLLFEDWRPKP